MLLQWKKKKQQRVLYFIYYAPARSILRRDWWSQLFPESECHAFLPSDADDAPRMSWKPPRLNSMCSCFRSKPNVSELSSQGINMPVNSSSYRLPLSFLSLFFCFLGVCHDSSQCEALPQSPVDSVHFLLTFFSSSAQFPPREVERFTLQDVHDSWQTYQLKTKTKQKNKREKKLNVFQHEVILKRESASCFGVSTDDDFWMDRWMKERLIDGRKETREWVKEKERRK